MLIAFGNFLFLRFTTIEIFLIVLLSFGFKPFDHFASQYWH